MEFRMMVQPGFFDLSDRLGRLSEIGDQLEAFGKAVDFEDFRADLSAALNYRNGPQGGRPPFDVVLMFKILVIQTVNNLSDDRTEFLINDRLSFMRFLGLALTDRVPDAKTIWLFREKLTKSGVLAMLFARFDRTLRDKGFTASGGQIVDASLISAPKQRNTVEEKELIKQGLIPESWKAKPAKLRQKDRDARWKVKYGKAKAPAAGKAERKLVDLAIPVFGYQNHVAIDRDYGLIRSWRATDAGQHETAQLRKGLLDRSNSSPQVWADMGYRSEENERWLSQNGFASQVHYRKPQNKPWPEQWRHANRERSPVRAKVEHVFAVQKNKMALFVRTIGLPRATTKIGLANLAYNIKRLIYLQKTLPI
jgi:IS5 family transposase